MTMSTINKRVAYSVLCCGLVVSVARGLVAADLTTPEGLRELRRELQNMIADRRELDGVRVQCSYDNNKIQLKGIYGRPGQLELIEQLIRDHRAQLGKSYSDFTGDRKWITEGDWKKVDVDEFRRVVQGKLATSGTGGVDLRGARIDRVFINSRGALSLAGVILDPRQPLDLQRIVIDLMRDKRWQDYEEGEPLSVDKVKLVPSPVPAARKIVSGVPELDGVRIDDAYYDSSGVLVFEGIQGKEGVQADRLREVLLKTSDNSDQWQEWTTSTTESAASRTPLPSPSKLRLEARLKPVFSGDEIVHGLERAFRDANLKTRLNEADPTKGFHEKVRIDRIFFNSDSQLALKGIRWNEIVDEGKVAQGKAGGALDESLRGLVTRTVTDYWPEVLSPPGFLSPAAAKARESISLAELASDRSGLRALWQWVPEHPELDGVRVDRAYYDGGILHLVGIEGEIGQTEKLQKLIAQGQPDSSLWSSLSPRGVKVDPLQPVPLPELKKRLQDRLGHDPDLSGTWLDRVYYGKERQLRMELYRWESASEDRIKKQVKAELDSSRADWERALEVAGEPDVFFAGLEGSLLQTLRQEVESRGDLDGVRLDAAVFDDKRVLQLEGLIGREEHRLLLDELLASTLAKHERWRRRLPNGWNVKSDKLRLLAIDPLRECVQNLIPAYRELDGVTIGRLYHMADGRLAICGRYANKDQGSALKGILGVELSRTEHGRIRLEKNVEIPANAELPVRPIAKDRSLELGRMEEFGVNYNSTLALAVLADAWQLYWAQQYDEGIRLLGMSLAYDPKCVDAWYLRALCHISKDQIALARRDIRRGVLLDAESPYRLRARHNMLTRVQGQPRMCFERLFQEALVTRISCPFVEYYCATPGSGGSCETCGSPCARRPAPGSLTATEIIRPCNLCSSCTQSSSVHRRHSVSCPHGR